MEQTFKVSTDTSNIDKSVDTLTQNINNLQKKQIKLVDGEEVQTTEQIKKNLIESEKVVTNLKTGSKTIFKDSDYDKAKTSLYKQLNDLQNDEYNIKQKLINADGEIKNQLEQQLQLVRKQQSEVGKSIAGNGLQDEGRINSYLKERQILTSNLTIAQEKYNQKQISEQL